MYTDYRGNFPKKVKPINDLPKVIIYTDGHCEPNPGNGGWAAVLIHNGYKKEIYGYEKNTTNNRMELKAGLMALELLKRPCSVELISDSQYFIFMFQKGWVYKWLQKGWMKKGEPIKNVDLIKRLFELNKIHEINWVWVRGHNGNHYNEICDKLASTASIRKISSYLGAKSKKI